MTTRWQNFSPGAFSNETRGYHFFVPKRKMHATPGVGYIRSMRSLFPIYTGGNLGTPVHRLARIENVPLDRLFTQQSELVDLGIWRARDDHMGPPVVLKLPDGTLCINDGNHRLARAFLCGNKTARVKVLPTKW